MNGASPEAEPTPHREPGVPFDVAGQRVEAVLNDLEAIIPGADLTGMSVEDIEDRALDVVNRGANSWQERDRNRKTAKAWRSLLPFVRSNNSIEGIDRDEQGKPIGLKVVVKEFPEK